METRLPWCFQEKRNALRPEESGHAIDFMHMLYRLHHSFYHDTVINPLCKYSDLLSSLNNVMLHNGLYCMSRPCMYKQERRKSILYSAVDATSNVITTVHDMHVIIAL